MGTCKHYILQQGKPYCDKYKVEVKEITKKASACIIGALLCHEEIEAGGVTLCKIK